MRILRRAFLSVGREWLIGLCAYALVVGPFGCEFQSALLDDSPADETLTTKSVGLFINSDTSSRILASGRAGNGDEFFVYGTRDAAGDLEEIESLLVRQTNGDQSFITFESGRPVHAQGPNGSYAHVTYTQVSSSRLTANVELFDASTAQTSHYSVDVDLQQTAAQIAAAVQNLTGRTLKTPTVPSTALSKDTGRETRITVFSPLFAIFVAPIIALVAITTVILGEILNFLYQAVTAALQAVLFVIFLPVFLIAAALDDTVFRVHFVGLPDVFDRTASEPAVTLRG